MLNFKEFTQLMEEIQNKHGLNVRDICEERLGTLWARGTEFYHDTIKALCISEDDIHLVLDVALACEKIRI